MLLGRNPDLRLVVCSYSATLALQFSRDCQSIMDSAPYCRLFPESIIPGIAAKSNSAVLSQSLPQLRAVILHPAPDRCVIDMGTAFLEQLLNIAQRERIAKIPPDGTKG